MSKYRFKTKEEFQADGLWEYDYDAPERWNQEGQMNEFLGQPIDDKHNTNIDKKYEFKGVDGWTFQAHDCTLNIEVEIPLEEILEQIKENNSLITKNKMRNTVKNTGKQVNEMAEKFVFMDKTVNVLNVGFSTCKNVVLYGPGE